jgi:hypothetical protein
MTIRCFGCRSSHSSSRFEHEAHLDQHAANRHRPKDGEMAAMIMAMLIWLALSRRPLVRLLQFVALVMFIKGSVVPTFLFGFYTELAPYASAA